MNNYLRRTGLYIARVAVMIAVLFVVMLLSGTSRVSGAELIAELFFSYRGAVLLVALVALGLWYAKLGYACTTMKASMPSERDVIVNGFLYCNYELQSEQAGEMIFRYKSVFRRVLALGEDKITVSWTGSEEIVLDGRRKDVSKVELRIRVLQN